MWYHVYTCWRLTVRGELCPEADEASWFPAELGDTSGATLAHLVTCAAVFMYRLPFNLTSVRVVLTF